jgi:tetratricopeptide (TPR) repeat protein
MSVHSYIVSRSRTSKPTRPNLASISEGSEVTVDNSALHSFPRAAPTFVGRSRDLARAAGLLNEETLHLVYGVAGIGKTEFVFKMFEQAQLAGLALPSVLVSIRATDDRETALGRIASAVGIRRAKTSLATGSQVDLEAEAVAIAERLEQSPQLVFIDDAHHIDSTGAGQLLGYLSRRVRRSRIVVASRTEITIDESAPRPVLHRLSPLSSEDTAALVAKLAERLGSAVPDAEQIFVQTGGSPFFVLRSVAGGGSQSGLEKTLSSLSADARDLLLMLAVAGFEIAADDIAAAQMATALTELSSKFFVDEQRAVLMVHDLVRDQVTRMATAREISFAHRALSDLLTSRAEQRRTASDYVAGIHHLVLAEEFDDAWDAASNEYRRIAAAGLDHLLLDDLRTIALRLPESFGRKDDVTLLIARILVRRSHITEASELLATIGDRGDKSSVRWLLLGGEVAQRRGRLRDAEDLFRRAQAVAVDATEQMHAALARADAGTLAGNGTAARIVLADLQGQQLSSTPRAAARWGWSLALSYLMEERFVEGAAAARQAAALVADQPTDDLTALLAMLEILALSECDQVEAARAVLAKTGSAATASGALRNQVLSGYRGVLEYHAGDFPLAARLLEQSFGHLTSHADQVLAVLAGYYRARVAMAQGQTDDAAELSSRLTRMATAAELETLVPHGRAVQSEALLAGGKVEEARSLAELALASPKVCSQAASVANAVLAELAALDGDIVTARQRATIAFTAKLDPAEGIAVVVDANIMHDVLGGASALATAWLELLGGDAERAAVAGAAAHDYYRRMKRSSLQNRAAVLRALALVMRGTSGDVAEADVVFESSRSSALGSGDARTLALCHLGQAALMKLRGNNFALALVETPGEIKHPEGRAVRAARGELTPPPGIRAMLSRLGLMAGMRHRVVTRHSSRIVSDSEIADIRVAHRVVVEPARAVIVAKVGEAIRIDRGRPLACELLAVLVEAQGAVIAAEQLFLAVWGAREYHPLRHRNTLYVAVKRLRSTLRDLLNEDRDLIETAAGGWRVVDELDAIVIRPESS